MSLHRLNTLDESAAATELRACCPATAWVTGMISGRPYKDTTALLTNAEAVWWDLSAEDWQEAFSAHAATATTATPEDLAARYAATFGYPFVSSSTAAAEIDEECRRRLGNDPVAELSVAATEMARIVNRRLRRLLEIA